MSNFPLTSINSVEFQRKTRQNRCLLLQKGCFTNRGVVSRTNMATDFDAIYEEEDEEERFYEESTVVNVPDPVVIRGAGNITVLVANSII